jgi:hypothetical protein
MVGEIQDSAYVQEVDSIKTECSLNVHKACHTPYILLQATKSVLLDEIAVITGHVSNTLLLVSQFVAASGRHCFPGIMLYHHYCCNKPHLLTHWGRGI